MDFRINNQYVIHYEEVGKLKIFCLSIFTMSFLSDTNY